MGGGGGKEREEGTYGCDCDGGWFFEMKLWLV